MTNYLDSNRQVWDAWTQHHLESAHHQDVATFRAGGLTVRSIEREALGDVRGRSLLHLQCNMGSDTLSWARLGARVTGIDFSEAAIAQAAPAQQLLDLVIRVARPEVGVLHVPAVLRIPLLPAGPALNAALPGVDP